MNSIDLYNLLVTTTAVVGGLMFIVIWRIDRRRELTLRAEELKLRRETEHRELEAAMSINSGLGSGGYIVLEIPEAQRPLFHDLLKGFEEYARLKGYTVSFSVDSTYSDRIGFKFTLKDEGINVGPERVRRDFQEYVERVRREEGGLDDMPVVTSLEEHQLLVTVLKNRISFLQHSYNLTRNALHFYDQLFSRMGSMATLPAPSVIVQTGGSMDSRNYKAVNSSRLIQGDSNAYQDNSVDQGVRIGQSFNERQAQLNNLNELLETMQGSSVGSTESGRTALRDLEKAREELEDEAEPDSSKIGKWLRRARQLIDFTKLGEEGVEAARKLFESFGIS